MLQGVKLYYSVMKNGKGKGEINNFKGYVTTNS